MDSLPSRAGQKGFDLLTPVDRAAIPDDQQLHRDLGAQVPQESGRIPAAEGPSCTLVCSQPLDLFQGERSQQHAPVKPQKSLNQQPDQ
jgi:hypothetical protein